MATTAKQAAKELIEHLPDQASWDDIMYQLYAKEKIESGLKAAEEGRTIPHEQIKARLLNRKNK
jgi:predicted transcriptional regulator